LYYEEAGQGKPIVLISGGSMLDRRGWDDHFVGLGRTHRVIRYDLRGLGASSEPTTPFSPYDDLESLLEHLEIDRAVLIGHSFGGGLAIDFCLDRPERVIAVVAETPALSGFVYSDAFNARIERFVSAYARGGGEACVEAMLSDSFIAPKDERVRERVRSIVLDNLAVLTLDPALIQTIEPPALDRLDEIRQPFLVISAERDDANNRAVADLLESRVANARRVELEDAGHLAHLEQPRRFNEIVLEFMRGLTEGRRSR
jgi:3-oxoadipate enol-lactonase